MSSKEAQFLTELQTIIDSSKQNNWSIDNIVSEIENLLANTK